MVEQIDSWERFLTIFSSEFVNLDLRGKEPLYNCGCHLECLPPCPRACPDDTTVSSDTTLPLE